MRHIALRIATALALTLAVSGLAAQKTSSARPSPEADFTEARAQFLERVVGHRIDASRARAYLAENGLDPDRIISEEVVIESVENANHTLDEEGNTLEGAHTATLRFRARLIDPGSASAVNRPDRNQADIFFTVIFALDDGQWRKVGSSAIWDAEQFLPPNDIRYGMRPFSQELSARLNDLPAFP